MGAALKPVEAGSEGSMELFTLRTA
jgi:hypothetical protein